MKNPPRQVEGSVYTSDKACLLRKSESGEKHFLLVFFLKANGLRYVMGGRSRRTSAERTVPDLFETGDVILHQRDPGKPAFLKEFSPVASFCGIGQNYRTLKAASALTGFYEKNLLHMEHFEEAWNLLLNALSSLASRTFPEATLFKTYFSFARSEGYPVIAHWLNRKPAVERTAISSVLLDPVEEVTTSASELLVWIEDLHRFFLQETDLLPPAS